MSTSGTFPAPGRVRESSRKFGVRHQQALLLFALLFFCNALRTNLSVAIVAMTDYTTNENFEVIIKLRLQCLKEDIENNIL